MINHLVFYLHRSLGIQQQACFKNSTAHVWCVLWGVFILQLHPIHHGQGFFLNFGSNQHGQYRHTHRMTLDSRMSAINITLCNSVTFLDDWTVRYWMTGHVTLFFDTQLAIRCSINRDAYRFGFRYMIQYSNSHFFISALALSPTLGTKFMSHSVSVHVTRVGLTQRKDRDKTYKVL